MSGEAVRIPIAVGEEPTAAYAVLPPGSTRGVVVLHEIFGPQPEIHRVVDRFGAAGYAAVAPDLFRLRSRSRLACIRSLLQATARGEGPPVEALARTRAWLQEATALPPARIGLVGFCITGGFVLAVGGGWGAVSTNYGEVPKDPARLRVLPPVIGCYGGRDHLFGRMGDRLRAGLDGTDVPHEVHTYETAGHSFLTDGHHPVASALTWPIYHIRYDAQVAEDAWGKILDFLSRHLA